MHLSAKNCHAEPNVESCDKDESSGIYISGTSVSVARAKRLILELMDEIRGESGPCAKEEKKRKSCTLGNDHEPSYEFFFISVNIPNMKKRRPSNLKTNLIQAVRHESPKLNNAIRLVNC